MKNKLYLPLILLLIIIFSFPSICFSELKTVEGEYCDVYLGDMKNKEELETLRKTVRRMSIENGIKKENKKYDFYFTEECIRDIINKYLEKVVIISHLIKGRKICDKVKITFDPDVIDKYILLHGCRSIIIDPYINNTNLWTYDIWDVLDEISDKINIGLIIETKIQDLKVSEREMLENEEEQHFIDRIKWNKDKYKVVDRRHLTKILEEQKLSSSGLTESETVKLGKLLNLDIIVLRLIYEKNKVTKVLKVDTGEVLLFKTYETEKKEEGWIYYAEANGNYYYYDKNSMTYVSPKVIKVWQKMKYSKLEKDKEIKSAKEFNVPIDGWDKLDYKITLKEVDCRNNTQKAIKIIMYNDQGKILGEYDVLNPTVVETLPESIGAALIRTVCSEK